MRREASGRACEHQVNDLTHALEALAAKYDTTAPDTVEFHASAIYTGKVKPWDGLKQQAQRREVLKEVLGIVRGAAGMPLKRCFNRSSRNAIRANADLTCVSSSRLVHPTPCRGAGNRRARTLTRQRRRETILTDPHSRGVIGAVMATDLTFDEYRQMCDPRRLPRPSGFLARILGCEIPPEPWQLFAASLQRIRAIFDAMDPDERRCPAIVDAGRLHRIATDSGTNPQEVSAFLRHFEHMRSQFRQETQRPWWSRFLRAFGFDRQRS